MKRQPKRAGKKPVAPPPVRIAPEAALPEVIERVVLRRQVQVEEGDVVIRRERLPRLNPRTALAPPFRYAVRTYPDPVGISYTSFQHAASEAEHLASLRKARVLYVENDTPTLLADHRAVRRSGP